MSSLRDFREGIGGFIDLGLASEAIACHRFAIFSIITS